MSAHKSESAGGSPDFAALLTWFHVWLGWRIRDFAADKNTRSSRTYRIVNELPTLLVIGIVILVVVLVLVRWRASQR